MRVPVKRYLDNKVTIMNDSDANGSKIKKIACIYNVAESHNPYTLVCGFLLIIFFIFRYSPKLLIVIFGK